MTRASFSRLLMCGTAFALLATAAHASSFEDALTAAYERNPRIKQERERLKGTDEGLAQAASGFRPTISGSYGRGRQQTSLNGGADNRSTYENQGLRLEQPLYRGGGTLAAMDSAKERIKAGQYELVAVEQQVLLDAVTAYMNVVANSSILELSRANERVLTEQLNAATTRFQVGEVTRTDVAQSQVRVSDAHTAVIAAEGQLNSAIATFERVVGYRPEGEFVIPTQMPELPATLEEALERGRAASPRLLAAIHAAKSSLYDVRTSKASLLPRVSLVGSISRDDGAGSFGNTSFDQDRLGVEVTVPLYQSGAEYSRVRQAKAASRQREHASIDARQAVDESVVQGWEQLQAATATMATRNAQIKSAELALEGVKQEHQFGVRTLLDVLDAEQELFAARTDLVRAERDRMVAAHTLAFRLGQLTPAAVGVQAVPYNPQANADDVAWKSIGF